MSVFELRVRGLVGINIQKRCGGCGTFVDSFFRSTEGETLPAEASGRIKAGDLIIGIEKEDDLLVKSAAAVSEMISKRAQANEVFVVRFQSLSNRYTFSEVVRDARKLHWFSMFIRRSTDVLTATALELYGKLDAFRWHVASAAEQKPVDALAWTHYYDHLFLKRYSTLFAHCGHEELFARGRHVRAMTAAGNLDTGPGSTAFHSAFAMKQSLIDLKRRLGAYLSTAFDDFRRSSAGDKMTAYFSAENGFHSVGSLALTDLLQLPLSRVALFVHACRIRRYA
jgi:hypothetical protein